MKELKNINDQSRVNSAVGPGYEFLKKLKLAGTGSPAIIYVDGIDFFEQSEEIGESMNRFNLELFQNGLVGRYNKSNRTNGCLIKRSEITFLTFETRRFIVDDALASELVSDANITIELSDGTIVRMYVPIKLYEEARKFFSKDWLEKATTFRMDEAEPIPYERGHIEKVLLRMLKGM